MRQRERKITAAPNIYKYPKKTFHQNNHPSYYTTSALTSVRDQIQKCTCSLNFMEIIHAGLSTEPRCSLILDGTENKFPPNAAVFCFLFFSQRGPQLFLSCLQHLFLGPEQTAYLKKINSLVSQKAASCHLVCGNWIAEKDQHAVQVEWMHQYNTVIVQYKHIQICSADMPIVRLG